MIDRMFIALAAFVVLAACGASDGEPTKKAAAPVETDAAEAKKIDADAAMAETVESVETATAAESAPATPVDMADAGRKAFTQCAVCHKVKDGERSLVGPNLYGIVGATAGAADFNYSDAVRNSGIVWNEENLDAFLENPRALIPGNRMAYAGERSAEKRAAIIEYLKSLTAE